MRYPNQIAVVGNFHTRVSRLLNVRRALITFGIVLMIVLVIAQQQRSHLASSVSGRLAQAGEQHQVSIPYFAESGDLSSTLTLNNNMPDPSEVSVTVYNSKGKPFTAPPIMVLPQNIERVSLRSLIENAGADFTFGSVQVSYRGPSMAVTSQVSIRSERQHLSFESVETAPMQFSSTRLDGIVWLPDGNSHAQVALTNTIDGNLSAIITTRQGQQIKTENLAFSSHETRVVDLSILGKGALGAAALVSLQHSGMPGALIATGFGLDETTGFSSNFPFVDRTTAKSNQLAGAHFRFGQPNGSEGFPRGTRFRAPLVVANPSDAPTKARLWVDYTLDSEPKRTDLGLINLASQELKQVDLATEMSRRGIKE